MQQITQITNKPKQHLTLLLENNETVDFKLYYSPRQQSWFYDFNYKEITQKGSRVVLTPNALRQFKKIIPFGISFSANSLVEPFSITDFSSGRVTMYILNASEVTQVEAEIFGQ